MKAAVMMGSAADEAKVEKGIALRGGSVENAQRALEEWIIQADQSAR